MMFMYAYFNFLHWQSLSQNGSTVTEAEHTLTFLGDFSRILMANFATVSTTVSTALSLGH